MRALAFSLFGPPPPKDAPRVTMLRWIRGFYLKPLPLVLAVYAMVALRASGTTIVLVLAALGFLVWLQGFISLTLRIGREDRREP